MLDVGLAGIEHGDFGGIGVKSRDFVARLGETQGQRQPYIAAADDGDLQLSTFEKLGFPVCGHELRGSPRDFWG